MPQQRSPPRSPASPTSRTGTTSPIKAAALQFSLAHPATAAVISGASKPERIPEDYAALHTKIPDDFWHELRDQHLVAANAPLRVDNLTRHGGLDIIKPRPAART
jgi:hypothetical protein